MGELPQLKAHIVIDLVGLQGGNIPDAICDGTSYAECACGWRFDFGPAPVKWEEYYAYAAGLAVGAHTEHVAKACPQRA